MSPAFPTAELWIGLAVIGMVAALLVVPLGFPGIWVMIGILTVATAVGEISPWLLIGLVVLGVAAEAAEYAILHRTTARFGAGRAAYWGAIAGGFVGVLVGMPVPVAGPLLAGLLGTFLGAAAVTFARTRRLRSAGRVAWVALLGRAFAAAFKTAAGVAILVLGGGALWIR
ncbi:MAG: DUF456 domain-containing protein [Gemmatimonadota bacterium]|nr:DUF456 domain-containing protein [Gemmatimonadota bacterium]